MSLVVWGWLTGSLHMDGKALACSHVRHVPPGFCGRCDLRAQELGIDIAPRLETIRLEEPPKRKGGIMVRSVQELVEKLRNEAKVL